MDEQTSLPLLLLLLIAIGVTIFALVMLTNTVYAIEIADTGPVITDVIIDEKISCIENGEQMAYITTNQGRFNVSRSMLNTLPKNTPISIRLKIVHWEYNDDARAVYRIESTPCEAIP